MKTSMKLVAVLGLGSLLTGACSKKEELPKGLFFSGNCKVEVKSQPEDAEIYLDGIEVGKGAVQVEIPCGEKQVMVDKHGFRPYYAYHIVDSKHTLKVSVSLSHLEHGGEDFALSNELIDQIHEGQKIWGPEKGARPETKDEGYPAYLGDMAALVASVKGQTATAGGGAEAFETGTWDKVDDWR
ncbi:MAG: PEGA domain-containing protein [Bdellovibrionota bacterium]